MTTFAEIIGVLPHQIKQNLILTLHTTVYSECKIYIYIYIYIYLIRTFKMKDSCIKSY